MSMANKTHSARYGNWLIINSKERPWQIKTTFNQKRKEDSFGRISSKGDLKMRDT